MLFGIITTTKFWATQGLTVVFSLFLICIYQRLNLLFNDTVINNLLLQKYQFDQDKRKIIKKISRMSEISRNITKFKKILCEQNYVPDNYADKRVKAWVDTYKNADMEKELKMKRKSMKAMKSRSLGFVGMPIKALKIQENSSKELLHFPNSSYEVEIPKLTSEMVYKQGE